MNAALTWARLSYRQQRWELLLVAVGVGAVAIGMVWSASQLNGMRAATPQCFGTNLDPGPISEAIPASCQGILDAYSSLSNFADNFLYASFAAPFGIGILLGAPLVAREIDGGTAQMAWSLGRSRTWWLLRRIAFIALFVALALGVMAVTSEILAAALAPDRNLAADFTWFGRRGWLIVARGVGALMLGMFVGAVIGRVLPAILAAALMSVVAFTGFSLAMDQWHHAEAVGQRFNPAEFDSLDPGALVVDFGVELLDGEVVSSGELFNRGVTTRFSDERGRVFTSEADLAAGKSIGHDVRLIIPGRRYPEFVARDAAMAGGLGVVALGLTAYVVGRRRPT